MAHVGEELRLVLARFGELAPGLLDLVEQSRILDRQDRLRGEGLQQIDGVLGKFANGITPAPTLRGAWTRAEGNHAMHHSAPLMSESGQKRRIDSPNEFAAFPLCLR